MGQNVLFRCDASPAIGTGHVMRCLTLADMLKDRGWNCIFWSSPQSITAVPALKRSNFPCITTPPDRCDVLIIDHYELDVKFETTCRTMASHILVIDDLADRPHDCDVLVDQTFDRDAAEYQNLVPTGCRILTGSEYALLRPQFPAMREESLKRRSCGILRRILVSAGGMNTHNITTRILEDIRCFNLAPLVIDVVLGKNADYMNSVRSAINFITNETCHKILLHTDIDDMAKIMVLADLAIGSGGTTSWERCCLGLPALVIEIADNQKAIATNLHKTGAVLNMGWYEDVLPDALSQAVANLFSHPEKLVTMGVNAAKVCDGNGTKRLAEVIENAVS